MFSLAVIVQIRSSENIFNVTERVDHEKNCCAGFPKTIFLIADPLGLPRTHVFECCVVSRSATYRGTFVPLTASMTTGCSGTPVTVFV